MPNKDPFELRESVFSSTLTDSTISVDADSINLNEDNLNDYVQSQIIQKQLDKEASDIKLESDNFFDLFSLFLKGADEVKKESKAKDILSDDPSGTGAFVSGIIGVGSGLVGMGEYLSLSRGEFETAAKLQEFGSKLQKGSQTLMTKDPSFKDHLYSGFGSMASFMVPGVGVGMSTAALGGKLATFLGLGTMTALEAATEAGQTWQETRNPDATNKVFAANIVLLALTNRFGLGSKSKSLLKKTLLASLNEGVQEAGQEIIQAVAKGEEPDWESVITSAGVGAIIGGGAHVFWGNKEQKEGLKITKKQWSNYIAATRNQTAKVSVPSELKETQAGFNAIQNFGVNLQNITVPFEVAPEEHAAALGEVEQGLPETISRVDNAMTKMVMDEHTTPNILDAITLLGKENFTNYLASLEKQDSDFAFTQEFMQTHPIYQLSNRTMHNITNAEMMKLTNRVLKVEPNLLNDLAVSQSGLDEQRQSLLEQDLIAGIALNFDSMSWGLLERKWKGIVTEEQLKPILDRAKTSEYAKLKPIGERALSDALQQFETDIQAEINARAMIEAEESRQDISESKRAIDDAITNPEANLIDEGGLNSILPPVNSIPDEFEFLGDYYQFYEDYEGRRYVKSWYEKDADPRFLVERTVTITEEDYEAARKAAFKELMESDSFEIEGVIQLNQRTIGSGQGNINYGEQLKDFKGSTFKDLWAYLQGKGITDNAEMHAIIDRLAPHIKDVSILQQDLGPNIAGQYIAKANQILLNSAYNTGDQYLIQATLAHEGLHAYTSNWMDTTPEGKKFAGRLQLAINTIQEIFRDPKKAEAQGLFMGTAEEIEDWRKVAQKQISEKETNLTYISTPKELLANIMTNTTQMMGFLSKVSAVSTPQEGGKQNMWAKIWAGLKEAWGSLLGKQEDKPKTKGNLIDDIIVNFWQYERKIQEFHKKRMNPYTPKVLKDLRDASQQTVTTGLTEEKENQENEDNNEDDDADTKHITNFVELAGALDGTDANGFRDRIKKLPTVNHFFSLINELDGQSDNQLEVRIKEIFEAGDFRDKLNPTEEQSVYEVFKGRFLTGLYNFIRSSEIAPFITFRTDYSGKQSAFSIVEQPLVFQMGDGTTKSSYVRPITLKKFLPKLAEIFGLEEKDLEIVHTAGFETYKNGQFQSRKSIKNVTPYNIGVDKENDQQMTQDLANKILMASAGHNKTFIYLGNFGGNNTLPMLAIPTGKTADVLLKAKQLLRSLGDMSGYGDGGQLTAAFRLALEDTWYGTPVTAQGFAENSFIRSNDLNALWKRGKKFIVEDRQVANDSDTVKRVIGNRTFTGTKVSGGEFVNIEFRAVAFDSTDDGFLTVDGEQIPVQSLLVNRYGTETTDGVTYYLFGEFDTIYNNLHGTLKDGVLKNVISAPGFYVKHSMQGVHRNSALGQWMIKHNIALLVSDTSRKIPKAVAAENVVRLSEGLQDENQVMNINIKNISRISESLYTDNQGATVKQMFNSSGLTKGNPLLENTSKYEDYFKAVSNMTDNSTRIALEKVGEMSSPTGLMKILRSIVNDPQSPRERAISRNLQNLITMEDSQFLKLYGGIINHPTIAKQIRQRLYRPLDAALQGRVAGGRAVLRPSVGFGDRQANVDPVTSESNLQTLFLNYAGSKLMNLAYPEKGLSELVKQYVELQRMETRMNNKGTQSKQGFQIVENGDIKEVTQREYIQWRKKEINQQIKAMSFEVQDEERAKALFSGNIYKAMNKKEPKVAEWLDNIAFGKQLVGKDGKITRGTRILDENGAVTEDWVIISRDIADRFGLKPGDRLIAVVTPTDSPLGIIAVRIGGIADSYGSERAIDRSSVIFNSEYIQSIVGKDYDIDTISLMPYDPDYWSEGDFDTVWETIYELKGEYKDWLAGQASLTLGQKIDKEQVFHKDILPTFYEKFIVQQLGSEDTGRLAGVNKFNPVEHFFAIDRNYLVDPNKAIVRRQFHTMLSAIGLESDAIRVNGKPMNWLTAHLLHLIDTNFSVDFPNKTSRLKYNPPSSDKLIENFAKYEWNVVGKTSDIKEVASFFRWLFGDALNLAAGENKIFGEKLDYLGARTLLQTQQQKLRLLQEGNITMLNELYLSEDRKRAKSAVNLMDYLKNVKIKDIMDYPLFRMVMSIDPNQLSMPGASYQDWMTDQARATREVIETSTHLSGVMERINNDRKKQEFLGLFNEDGAKKYQPLTEFAIKLEELTLEMDFLARRKDQPNSLNTVRNDIITLIQAYDEINEPKRGATNQDLVRYKRHARARANVYPLLFNELLKSKRVKWRNGNRLELEHNGVKYYVARTRDSQLALKKGSGDWYLGNSINEADTDEKRALRDAFTKPDGVWSSASNRLQLNNIGLAENINVDQRINILKPYIADKVYGDKSILGLTDVQALWLSFLSQVANDGLTDNKAQGLVLAKYLWESTKPADFQGNDVALELLAHFEPGLYAQWVSAYSFLNQETNRQTIDMGIRRLAQDPEGPGEVLNSIRFDETDGPASVRLAFRMLADEIKSFQPTLSDREFAKMVKTKGYGAGLKVIKGMIQNEAILEGLAASDIFFGELLYDIKNLSASAFEKKYDEGQLQNINTIASLRLSSGEYEKNFLTEQFGTEKYDNIENIPKLIQIYSVLKAAQETKVKADKMLNPVMRKLGINYLSYKFIGPYKENKIYAAEKKNTRVDSKFTKDGVKDLSLDDVDTHMRVYATRTYQTHGLSSEAIAKNQEMNTALNLIQTELSSLIKSSDEMVDLIVSSGSREDYLKENPVLTDSIEAAWVRKHLMEMRNLPKEEAWDARRKVFETAENMEKNLQIRILGKNGIVTGYMDLVSNTYVANDPLNPVAKYNFIDQLFKDYPAQRKLEILAALNLRELYDIKVPHLLDKALGYLQTARESINIYGNYDSVLEVQALIDRYTQYSEAVKSRMYNYMPHMYPIELYKTWWYSEYKALVEQKLAAQIKRAQILLKQGDRRADPELASIDTNTENGKKIFKAKVESYLKYEWEQFRVGNPTSYIIPNFLARKVKESDDLEYIKGTTDMHYNYVNNLITGLRNDMMFADWLNYLSKARRFGERSYLIEATKMWYADQIQHKMLHTKPIEIKSLERGMQINFTHDSFTMDRDDWYPRKAGVQIWGIVDKVDLKNNKLHLKVDADKVKYEAEQDLLKIESILRNMSVDDQLAPATFKQVMMIKNQLQRGYIQSSDLAKPLEELTIHQAAQLIIKGNQWVLNNLDKIGVYNLNEIYTRNLRGQLDRANVNRYMRRGAVERLDGWAREIRNLRGDDGSFASPLDAFHYGMLKGSSWVATHTISGIKNTQAMAFLGAVVAPKAFAYNYLGAGTSNIIDAPITHIKLSIDARKEWASIKHISPSKMTKEQKEWYTTMVSLGLANNKDLVAISLQAGNIDSVDVLSQQGAWDAIRYLAKGIIEGAPYQAYLKRMDELRTELIISDFDDKVYLKILEEEELWKAKVDGLVKKKIKKLNQAERDTAISAIQAKERKGLPIKRSFAQEVNLTQIQALKQAAQLVQRSMLRGWLGLGLQAKAEVLRRPGFYIGYQTAISLGFNKEQAIQMGINSIEARHAFYSSGYKQFGANTKLGALMQQFSQYSWNQFVIQFRLWREAVPQTMMHWTQARMSGQNPFQAFWTTVMKRTTPMLDAYGKQVINRQNKEVGELNIAHYLMMRYGLGFMLMQAGTRAFYGMTNWQDPMVQLFYKLGDMLTDIPKGDFEPEELGSLLWFLSDTLFFLGVPYKLAMQFTMRDPNQDVREVVQRGRVEDQIDFIYRVNNEIAVLRNPYLRLHKEYKRNLEQVDYWFDDVLAGVKFFGYSAPDKSGQPYMRWGFYPGLSDEWPFVEFNKEVRMITPPNTMRYYDTNKQGIGGKGKEFQRFFELGLSPWTYIPYGDKLFYPNKRNR